MYINNLIQMCPKTEGDIFSSKPIQNTIENSTTVEYRPVSTGLDECLEFLIPESPDYIDTTLMKLYIKVKILDSTGAIVKNPWAGTPKAREGTHVAPCNNFLGSLFSNVQIFLNHKCISSPGNQYFYRSYIEKLCNYSSESKKTHLAAAMYYDDEFDKFDNFENKGSLARMARMGKSGSLEMIGYLHTDLSSLNKLMLNNVNIRLKLYRNKPSFSLMTSAEAVGEYKINITDAVLLVRKVKINPSVALANEIFLKKSNARYNIERVEIKSFVIPEGTSSRVLDNCFISQMPKRILMMSVEEEAEFNYLKNPYYFKNFGLSYAHLTGDVFASIQPIITNYGDNEYMQAYTAFNESINTFFHDNSVGITPEMFKESTNIIGWDLTPDLSASQPHASIPKSGVLRLELKYVKPLPSTIKVMLYAEYESFINIDSQRNIYTDYAC